ncbi:uncharacterized protein LDX57_009911 [Aspergillus melleus]|uniref:uncharacterized protein n=1 Tax=Aspergillus melleus TaxID=138277 RepID=UPI001E8EE724|nr:uncharacterized protein LDX57_009911 [Aspergillus melleus]KAH8432272.1 hypothetical protein LDX57_009911 [Aspergillus melleus]
MSDEELPFALNFAKENFDDECTVLRKCQGSGLTPQFFDSLQVTQDATDLSPTGYARMIVMSNIPGKCVLDILPSLTPDDRSLILAKLSDLLEYIRLRGWIFFEQETEQVYYDEQTKKVYLIGFCRAVGEDFPPEEGQVITPDSIDVGGFGLG